MKRLTAATCSILLALSSCQEPIQPGTAGVAAIDGTRSSVLGPAWSPSTDMTAPRWKLGAAAGADGRIYIAGGIDNNFRVLATAEVFDPVTGVWSDIAPMPAKQENPNLLLNDDGLLYAVGGADLGCNCWGIVHSYDPISNRWREGRPDVKPVFGAAAALLGKLYLLGGYEVFGVTPSAYAYDPATGAWASVRKMDQPRAQAAAATLDGKLYVVGGVGGDFRPSATGASYDPRTDVWTPIAPMSATRVLHRLEAGADGMLYAIGGSAPGRAESSVEKYDPRSNTWSEASNMLNGRSYFATARLPGGQIYAMGGCADQLTGGDLDMCAFIAWKSVEVLTTAPANLPPVANIGGPYSGKEGQAVQFDATASFDPEHDALSYNWDFGDGATMGGLSSAVTHVYATAGTYTATLTVRDPAGLSSGASTSVVITALTPAEGAAALDQTVTDLLASGAISAAVGDQLTPSIDATAASLAKGNTTAATGQLSAFVNKVKAAIKTGKLDAATGNALIAAAQKILNSLP